MALSKHKNRGVVIIGKRYGSFVIIEDLGSIKRFGVYRTMVKLMCDCGNTVDRFLYYVKSGGSKSCGCLRRKMAIEWGKERGFKHGKSKHPLMRVWDAMIQRCYNTNNKHYHNYGGDGILVCKDWVDSYESFYDWAILSGWQRGLDIDKDIIPQKLGIPGKLYSPEMCCFVTRYDNNRAKRNNVNITFNGVTMCLSDWASKLGISSRSMRYRINNWDLELAITTPIIKKYADRIKVR